MADANGRPADPLRGAALGILVLGNLERAFKSAPDYWIIDGSIAAQNMILAAHAMGIGSVWPGTYPQMERVEAQRKLFGLPDTIIPHSIIAFGYPDSSKDMISESRSNLCGENEENGATKHKFIQELLHKIIYKIN